jgi:hypothetical protein
VSKLVVVLLLLCPTLHAQSREVELTAGYNYQNSDQGEGVRTNLNGWYASAQYDLNSFFAMTVEADNYYGNLNGQSQSQQNFIMGPQFTFRADEAKLRPFLYAQSGDQRSVSQDSVAHAFNLQLGGGVQVKLSERFSLQLSPAEYSLVTESTGPTHSFSSKVGVIWTAWKSR